MALQLSGAVDASFGASLLSAEGAVAGLGEKLKTLNAAQQKISKFSTLRSDIKNLETDFKTAR